MWVILAVAGVVMISAGAWWWQMTGSGVSVEVIKAGSGEVKGEGTIWVDVGGAVVNPGVYQLAVGARIKDALTAAGGLSAEADRAWVERSLNLAQNLIDGYKVFIPKVNPSLALPLAGEGTVSKGSLESRSGCVSVNTGSKGELDGLAGIGEVRAEAIIAGRPYGRIEELTERKIVPKSVLEKVKQEICL